MSRLDEIQARLDAATPGPWGVDHDDESVFNDTCVTQGNYGWVASGPDSRFPAYDEDTEQGRADAELIAHAPADLAALVKFARVMEGLHRPRKVICLNPSHSSDCDAMVCDTCDTPWPCPTAKALEQIGGAS